MIIVDTGPIVALANKRDSAHARCRWMLRTYPGRLLIPQPIIAETGYMLGKFAGTRAEAGFHREIAHGAYEAVPFDESDFERVGELVEKYGDLPLGTADACVVVAAERYKTANIATLDRKHFSIIRPRHVPAFTLLP